ncbi:hypothetical protein C1H46_030780 [Malus baccata]|uniref:Uncharacterized protein n=1 Tax=Malus baccata TaxID=106549 RepID=A0A540LB24_MALBA|nr:hypothetical protein C1H46_030780 [Malus baccata]
MATILKLPAANCTILPPQQQKRAFLAGAVTTRLDAATIITARRQTLSLSSSSAAAAAAKVNGCSGKMGKAIIQAANSAGLTVVPVSFGSAEESGQTVQVGTNEILVHGPHERESTLASLFQKYPNLIVVDFTVPSAVSNNAELYCKVGVPFVMGTLPRLLFLASRSWGCPLMWNREEARKWFGEVVPALANLLLRLPSLLEDHYQNADGLIMDTKLAFVYWIHNNQESWSSARNYLVLFLGALYFVCSPPINEEEICFLINPELIASMLFMPSMEDNEATEIIGAERFSNYTG